MKEYFIWRHENASGPFTINQLKQMWMSGNLDLDTQFSDNNGESWNVLRQLAPVLEGEKPLNTDNSDQNFSQLSSVLDANDDSPLPPPVPSDSTDSKAICSEPMTPLSWTIAILVSLLFPIIAIILGLIYLRYPRKNNYARALLGLGLLFLVFSIAIVFS